MKTPKTYINGIQVCPMCKNPLPEKRNRSNVFCGKTCRDKSYVELKRDKLAQDIAPSSRGTIAELMVCSDLLLKGFEVYRAVSPSAKCDIIAVVPSKNVIVRLEVKSSWVTYTKSDGSVVPPYFHNSK